MTYLLSLLAPYLIPILVPFVLAGAKAIAKYFERSMPSALLPPLAAALGAGIEVISATTTCPSGVPPAVCGAVLGLAGVGLRELIDQTRDWRKFGAKSAK